MYEFNQTEVGYYYDDCAEAFEKGEQCSGVYTIKPDNLPPFEVSDELRVCFIYACDSLDLYTIAGIL